VEDRRRLLQAYDEKIRGTVLPAYRRLHDYLAREYCPRRAIRLRGRICRAVTSGMRTGAVPHFDGHDARRGARARVA